jgi:hypothetical protein
MKKILIFLLFPLLLGSCIKEITDVYEKSQKVKGIQWNPTIAAPLVSSSLGIRDALDQLGDSIDFLRVESDGGLTVFYSVDYETPESGDILKLSDQLFADAIALTSTELSDLTNTGSVTVNRSFVFDYNVGSSEIDRLLWKLGNGMLSINSSLQHDIDFEITFPRIRKNGTPLSASISSNYVGVNPLEDSVAVDFTDYDADLTKTSQGHSEFAADVTITINRVNGNAVGLFETVAFGLSCTNQRYREAIGYFGNANFAVGVDTLNIDLLENTSNGSFTAFDPRLKFVFTNSFGIPIEMKVLEFKGINNDNNAVDLTGLPDPLPFPNLGILDFKQSKKDSLVLNRNTSNLADFLGNLPAKVVYHLDVTTNPDGNTVNRNWITDESKLKVEIGAELPIHGTARDFEFEQIQPFEFDLEQAELIEEVLLRIYTENGLPVDLALQAYFEDSTTNTVLDSLFGTDQLVLAAAPVGSNGRVTQASPKTTDVTVNAATADNLTQANRIRFVARFNTSFEDGSQPPVKFYDDYEMLIQLGVQGTVNVKQDF